MPSRGTGSCVRPQDEQMMLAPSTRGKLVPHSSRLHPRLGLHRSLVPLTELHPAGVDWSLLKLSRFPGVACEPLRRVAILPASLRARYSPRPASGDGAWPFVFLISSPVARFAGASAIFSCPEAAKDNLPTATTGPWSSVGVGSMWCSVAPDTE